MRGLGRRRDHRRVAERLRQWAQLPSRGTFGLLPHYVSSASAPTRATAAANWPGSSARSVAPPPRSSASRDARAHSSSWKLAHETATRAFFARGASSRSSSAARTGTTSASASNAAASRSAAQHWTAAATPVGGVFPRRRRPGRRRRRSLSGRRRRPSRRRGRRIWGRQRASRPARPARAWARRPRAGASGASPKCSARAAPGGRRNQNLYLAGPPRRAVRPAAAAPRPRPRTRTRIPVVCGTSRFACLPAPCKQQSSESSDK